MPAWSPIWNSETSSPLATTIPRAFVAAHEWHFDGDRPVAHHGVEIGVADSGVADFDEDLVGTGLGDGDLFVDEGPADFFGDLGPLSLGDGHFGG